jgi:predicted DsbA family dithiol-disulfide isomerase
VKRTFKKDVDEDWSLSRKKGITAVPTFVMNKDKLVGAHPYETLEKLMEANGVRKK